MLDPAAQSVMRLSLLDWLACGKAGVSESVSVACRSLVLSEGGFPQATLFGGGAAPARSAALVNGATSHALDYDDTHFAHIGHPSVAVLPAAMALGETHGRSLTQVLEAALLGVEASIRFGQALGRSHYQIGFHQTATAGAFGAALAAAKILGLDDDARRHALALVSTRASGLKAQFGTMGKPYNAGIAAANGVEAAALVAHGMRSNLSAFEGLNGFLRTHHGEGRLEASNAPAFTTVSHKFHACCHGLHACLEALDHLPKPSPSDIQSIHVTTHPRWMTVCHVPEPRTGLELKFSYRGILAAAVLGYDTAALDTYSDALCANPDLIRLRDLTYVADDASLTETEAIVRIDTADGSYEGHFDLDAPLPLAERTKRVRNKAAALLGVAAEQALWSAISEDNLARITEQM